MIASPHLSTGAVISKLASKFSKGGLFFNLILSFILGIASHILMDMIPHTEYIELFGRYFLLALALDLFYVLCFVYFLGASRPDNNRGNYILWAGLIGSTLPDVPGLIIEIFKINWIWLNKLEGFIQFFHAHYSLGLLIGFYYQIFLSFVLLLVLFLLNPDRKILPFKDN